MSIVSRIKAFFTPSVDSIVAGITYLVKKLEDAVQHHTAKADQHTADAAASTAAAAAATAEAVRAAAVSEKLKALVS